jgi:hypothetical protein
MHLSLPILPFSGVPAAPLLDRVPIVSFKQDRLDHIHLGEGFSRRDAVANLVKFVEEQRQGLAPLSTDIAHMDIHCNAGVTSTNLIGDLPGYGKVWYHPNGIANILPLKRVKTLGHRVTYNSSKANNFHGQKVDGTTRVFKESPRGLYYSDTSIREASTLSVNTVDDNKSKYTNRHYSRAVLAQKNQKMIARPSTRSSISILEKNLLPNCPVTRRDIAMAEDIFGPDLGSLKGKTVRSVAAAVNVRIVDIPAIIMTHYRHLILGGDIMFVNKIPIFMMISRHMRFGTREMLQNQKCAKSYPIMSVLSLP